jgi:hypothetical protein
MATLESRQDDIDVKVSQVLASTASHTETLAELKYMLARYIGKDTTVVEGSPSSFKPILEDQVRSPSLPPAFDGLKEVDVDITSRGCRP